MSAHMCDGIELPDEFVIVLSVLCMSLIVESCTAQVISIGVRLGSRINKGPLRKLFAHQHSLPLSINNSAINTLHVTHSLTHWLQIRRLYKQPKRRPGLFGDLYEDVYWSFRALQHWVCYRSESQSCSIIALHLYEFPFQECIASYLCRLHMCHVWRQHAQVGTHLPKQYLSAVLPINAIVSICDG